MIKGSPQHLTPAYWADIAEQLSTLFYSEVLKPVVAVLRQESPVAFKIENAVGDAALKRALQSGRVQYRDNVFRGTFSAQITIALKRLGAIFDKRNATFLLPIQMSPHWVIDEAARYWTRAHAAHLMISDELARALKRATSSAYYVDANKMVGRVDAGWRASAKRLEVKPELTSEGKEALAANYSHNMDLWIKKWLKQDIIALRRDVQQNAEAGYRFDSLIEKVRSRKSVSESKAKFLARQETSLFMSQYRSQRFQGAGVIRYQWSTSHDARVRPSGALTPSERMHAGNHRILDGQIFSYLKKAPAQYMSCRKPCNPGEDYLCRCVDIPIYS